MKTRSHHFLPLRHPQDRTHTSKGDVSKACCTMEAVLKMMGSVIKGEWMGRGSKRLGWLHTFLNCIKMLITDMKWPLARVSLVLNNRENERERGIFKNNGGHSKQIRTTTPKDRVRVSLGKYGPCHASEEHSRGLCHEVVVEEALSLGETAAHHMLVFLGHLLLHVHFYTPQQEGSKHLQKKTTDVSNQWLKHRSDRNLCNINFWNVYCLMSICQLMSICFCCIT